MKTGHIRIFIDKKICFEYYELEKPEFPLTNKDKEYLSFQMALLNHEGNMKEYEASKRLVEVVNITMNYDEDDNMIEEGWVEDIEEFVKNNQQCKAEIKDNKAIIIKLIK